ncbi:hypothetical protein VTJ49DRAFT_615 [Mycothermus thermophilus]|uniref:Uncharacterized protein n=1 Tax=Humicola insolens TaxID=85995 RepID=A0ABR3VR31_HUMIN
MVDLNWNHFGPVPDLDPEARAFAERFYHELKAAFPVFVADFETKFGAWQRRWFDRETSHSASVIECCELPEYDAVLLLGPKTIPLVVHELCDPRNLFATVLCMSDPIPYPLLIVLTPRVWTDNHLETDPSVKVNPNDVLNYLTLNRQANLIVELNHARAQRAQARIEEWGRQTQARRQGGATAKGTSQAPGDSPNSDADTSSAEYAALVGMGPGIISHVMRAYAADRSMPWWKVMYQLVCEEPPPAGTAGEEEEQQYERWKDWFEHMEHHEAAEGLNPEYLRRMGMPAGSDGA